MNEWIDEEPTRLKERPISPSKGHQIKHSVSHTHDPSPSLPPHQSLGNRLSMEAGQADPGRPQSLELFTQRDALAQLVIPQVSLACLLPADGASRKGHFEHRVRNLAYLKDFFPKRKVRVQLALGHYEFVLFCLSIDNVKERGQENDDSC